MRVFDAQQLRLEQRLVDLGVFIAALTFVAVFRPVLGISQFCVLQEILLDYE